MTDELVLRLWDHAVRTVTALAALHDDTPRTIADGLFEHMPGDEEHRADIEKRVARLRRLLG